MTLKQISVNLGKVPGSLSRLSTLLYREDFTPHAIHIFRHQDDTLVQLIMDDADKLTSFLGSYNFSYRIEPALAVLIPTHPGGLHAILRILDGAGIIIHQLYPSWQRGKEEMIILEVDKPEEAKKLLRENWIEVSD